MVVPSGPLEKGVVSAITDTAEHRVGVRASAGYASGSLVTGAFTTVPGLLLLPYLTDTLGVAAGLAGALVFAAKAWTVLLNPVAGRVSDRTTTRIGPRRPYVLGRRDSRSAPGSR